MGRAAAAALDHKWIDALSRAAAIEVGKNAMQAAGGGGGAKVAPAPAAALASQPSAVARTETLDGADLPLAEPAAGGRGARRPRNSPNAEGGGAATRAGKKFRGGCGPQIIWLD